MNTLKFIGIALLVLLAVFICYGIYFAVLAYMFVIKLLVIAMAIAGFIWIYLKAKKKN